MTTEELDTWLAAHARFRDGFIFVFTLVMAVSSLILSRRGLQAGLSRLFSKTAATWDDMLMKRGVFDKLAWLAPAMVIYISVSYFAPVAEPTILRLLQAYSILVFMVVAGSLLTAINDIYSTTKSSKDVPIKGYLQVLKLLIYITGSVLIFAVLLRRSPWVFLSGIGAATAVLLLVFKDTILSFVASIQLATNDMIRIGDWIEFEKYNADGEVIDIALHTIKVQNWDLTITTIPTFKLIEDSFRNWRGMQSKGARRIKRAVFIDIGTINFLSEEDLQRLERAHLLTEYIQQKRVELERDNRERGLDLSTRINGRRMTNLGTLRAYLEAYLRANKNLRQDMSIMVRQLSSTSNGVPLEIYAFSADTAWANFETIQSDIFDHVLAIVPEFGLAVYQSPNGRDFKRL
jgi:miniconductance mechanosensitive channel